jgi:hypothetical protein
METINPKDVGKLDFDSISFITLKNGDMIMIDGSAPEKYKSEAPKYDNYSIKSKNNIQNLEVMKQLSFTYKGKNKYNNTIDKINNKIILKNDFNSISYPSKAMNLSFKGISNNKFALNNFQNLPIKQNIKKNSLFEISNINNNINLNNKRLSYNPEINPNINTLKKATENNNNNSSETNSNNPPSSTRNNNINNLNIQTLEMTEEEKLDQRIKRKSRNYLERLSLIFNEKNKPLVNAVISLKIPSDVNRQISETEKEFDMMVTQLKQKRSKYNFSRTGNNLYNKYYELYKDNNKEVKYLNLNRIKYYQEAENDNKENEPQMNNNETLNNNNNQRMVDNTFNINNTIYVNNKTNFGIGLTDTNLNNKVMNSFYGEKNRATRDNNNFSSRIRTNSSSSLVCPSNIIKNKLNSEF